LEKMKLPALIVDIDGTLALHTEEERGHFDYSKVIDDRPNWPVINMITRILGYRSADLPRLVPVFMSGRADENDGLVREHTEIWMHTYTNWSWDISNLFMRPEFLPDGKSRDFRKDYVVKKELYHKYVEPSYHVVGAIDDRPQVLRMWHELGIPTFAVGTPWIEF
jgi:hypothetical protein